jgi:hypothetical protein
MAPSRFAGLSDLIVVSEGVPKMLASLIRINFPEADDDRVKVGSSDEIDVSLNASLRPLWHRY